MSTEAKIDAFLEASETSNDRSKLAPYAKLVRELRRKKWTFKRITEALNTEFGVSVTLSTVQYFYKRLSKKPEKTSPEVPHTESAKPTAAPASLPPTTPVTRRFNIDA